MRVVRLMGFAGLLRVVLAFLACWVGGSSVYAAAAPRGRCDDHLLAQVCGLADRSCARKVLLVDPFLSSEFGPEPRRERPRPDYCAGIRHR